MRIVMAAATLLFAVRYLFELWLFYFDRPAFDRAAKRLQIFHGNAPGREVSVADRLLISFPLAIGVCGVLTYLAWTAS